MIFDKANEALKNWKSLLPMLRPLIKNETKNAVRRKKMNVTVAPNGTTIGVQDPNDNTTIRIPYQPACANVLVGNSVWVEWVYDNFSTAIAVTPGNGVIPSPLPVNQGGTGSNAAPLTVRYFSVAYNDLAPSSTKTFDESFITTPSGYVKVGVMGLSTNQAGVYPRSFMLRNSTYSFEVQNQSTTNKSGTLSVYILFAKTGFVSF